MNYFYKVYGLNIQSEILIHELSELDCTEIDNIDLKISYKDMNVDIKESIKNGKIAEYKRNDMWFYIKQVATYRIQNGDTVHIEPYKNYDFQMLKTYILGSVLGMVLIQKNIVAIHGGGIVINEKGYVFTGHRGAGKSTITTALRQRGYKFVADDVCSIKNGDINMISHGFGYQKLCEDAMIKLGYDTFKYKAFRSDRIRKYSIPTIDQFIEYEVPFEAVFEICVDDVENVCIEEVLGVEKMDRLVGNIFRIEMINNAGGMTGIYLKKCANIAKNIKYYKITRPKNVFSVEEQINEIESLIFSKEKKRISKNLKMY